MEQKNIEHLSLIELKALAFDELARVQMAQNNLVVINNLIQKKAQQAAEDARADDAR